MANTNSPMGGKPIGSFQSATFNELIHKYVIPATDSNDFFIGDFVKTVETSENGVPICVLADATDPIRGVIAGFEADHDYEDRTYRLGNIRRTAYVCDDPDIEIEIQASGTLTSTDIGKNATILYAAGNATTGLSGTLLDASTLTTLAGQLKIVRMAESPLSELGEYTKVYCKIVDHELAQGGTVQSFLDLSDTPAAYVTAHAVYKVNGTTNAVVEAAMTCDDSGNVYIPGKLTVDGMIDPTGLLLDGQVSPPSTTDGTQYYDSVLKKYRFKENGSWVVIPVGQYEKFTASAGQTAFTITVGTPSAPALSKLAINGQLRDYGVSNDYTISGTALTWYNNDYTMKENDKVQLWFDEASADGDAVNSVFYVADTGANLDNYRVRSVGSGGTFRYTGRIPSDFNAITKMVAIASPNAAAAGTGKDIDIYSSYGTTGEAINVHTESDTTTTYNTGTTDNFFELDISGIFTTPSAGDMFGVQIDNNIGSGTIYYYGILLEYT